jgi:DNA mismatch repair protein MSH6
VVDSEAARGSVLAQLDHCVTPGGKRHLRRWLCRPLQSVEAIQRRQDAVAELMGPLLATMDDAAECLVHVGDIERGIVRLAVGSAGALSRDAPHVVLYEDTSKRRVHAVSSVLWALQKIEAAVEALEAAQPMSDLLKELMTWGKRLPDFREELKGLIGATDWKQAEEVGRLTPKAGVDAGYDDSVAQLQAADDNLTVRPLPLRVSNFSVWQGCVALFMYGVESVLCFWEVPVMYHPVGVCYLNWLMFTNNLTLTCEYCAS